MGKYSSDSDNEKRRSKGSYKSRNKRRSSSGSSDSRSHKRKSNKNIIRHRSRSRNRSKYSKSRKSRSTSGSSHKSKSSSKLSRSRDSIKYQRSNSRDYKRRSQSKDRHRSHKSRSRSYIREYTTTNSSSSSKIKHRSSSSSDSSSDRNKSIAAGTTYKTALKAATLDKSVISSIDTKMEIDLMAQSVSRIDSAVLNEINKDVFVQKQFNSSNESKKVFDNIVIDLKKQIIKVPEVEPVEPDSVFHHNLFLNEETRMEKWVKELYSYRQKELQQGLKTSH